jgi:ABC-type sugar transport system ATPase subunit
VILTLRGIGKRYGAVEALRDTDLDVAPGDVLGICGEQRRRQVDADPHHISAQ